MTSLIGFIGLGNMGEPMAGNLAAAGNALTVFDVAGTAGRAPASAVQADSCARVAQSAETVILSLPDGDVVESVVAEMLAAASRMLRTVVDTSTIGIDAATALRETLGRADVEYVDAPVSGGVAGARAGTVSVMFSGSQEAFARLRPLLEGMAGNVFYVGETQGQGQAMKLLNNFLSATAMAATSEAVAFGVSQGLDMGTLLDVLNVSSGQNTASADKFPRRILTQSYDAGFSSRQFNKDLRLYRDYLRASGGADPVSAAVVSLWQRLEAAQPGVDMTRIYPFVRDKRYLED